MGRDAVGNGIVDGRSDSVDRPALPVDASSSHSEVVTAPRDKREHDHPDPTVAIEFFRYRHHRLARGRVSPIVVRGSSLP